MESEFHLGEYIAILKRRYIYLILPFLVVLAGSIAVSVLLPPVYESTGTILIESPQIPKEMIQSTETSLASERIQIIKQRVMTRSNLFRIVQKFDIFKDDKEIDSTTKAVDKMRKLAIVELINSDGSVNRRRGATAIAFKVSFEHRSPEVAVRVANELVTLFLAENVKSRTARASETTEFLTKQASNLEKNLQGIEDKIANYKQENASALPDHLNLRLEMRDRSQVEYQDLDREIKAQLGERRFLEIEVAGLKAGYRTRQTAFEIPRSAVALDSNSVDRQKAPNDLASMKDKLTQLLIIYSPSHPDVKSLKRRISVAEKTQKSAVKAPVELQAKQATPKKIDPIMATVLAKIESVDSRIKSMRAQKKQLKDKISEIETKIIQTPQVERALKTLNRDYENAKRQYDDIRAKQMEAQLSKNLEEDRKAERFVLLEPPVLPEEPIRPNRKKILSIGVLLSFAAGGAGIFLVELIDGSIRGTLSLAVVTKLQPLASIPYIVTTKEARRRKRMKVLLLLGFLLLMMATLTAVHFFYMPLDIVFYKVIARF